jgi:hypothetical protein
VISSTIISGLCCAEALRIDGLDISFRNGSSGGSLRSAITFGSGMNVDKTLLLDCNWVRPRLTAFNVAIKVLRISPKSGNCQEIVKGKEYLLNENTQNVSFSPNGT